MTNRRKGSKTKASTSKKSESPDKQARRLSKRNKRSRKSDSPEEQPEEVGSEYSFDENTEDEGRGTREVERDIEDTSRQESDPYDIGKTVDDQKLLLKEEESGGSDGSWKVKSENGGSGGIPKLKLCLTRPPDMSSPSSEQPSPRRRRRGKGNASPAPQEFQEALREEKDSPKRSTRSQKAKEAAEQEIIVEVRQVEEPQQEMEPVRSEVCDSTNINHSDNEYEIQMAIDSITVETQVQEETEEKLTQNQQNEPEQKEENVTVVERDKEPEKEETENVPPKNEVVEAAPMEVDITESPKRSDENMEVENREEPKDKDTEKDEEKEVDKDAEKDKDKEADKDKDKDEDKDKDKDKAEVEVEVEVEVEKEPEKRPPSRDSSEERAKEEALRSRNKFKKAEQEKVEPKESTVSEKSMAAASAEEDEKSQSAAGDAKSDTKENQEELIPAKSNSRKRRWGASTSRVTKKTSVSISTDFLKEIIPEVKPLPMSEVQLSPNEEDDDSQAKDNEENQSVPAKKIEKGKMVPSDESEKDYEEEPVESGAEESPRNEYTKAVHHLKEKEFTTMTRKVSVLPSNDVNKIQRSPSPPRNKPSNILYIVNLVRPFTIPQLRELLARTGTIVEDGFWIDKIKSRCYVKYETEEEAKTTRHALHGVRWPVSNPKQLNVDFGTEAAMKAAQDGNEIVPKRQIPSLFDKQIDMKSGDKNWDRDDRSRDKKEKSDKDKKESRNKQRDEKRDEEEKEKKSRPTVELLVRDRTVRRVTVPVREWDVGKNEDGFSPPHEDIDYGRHRDDRFERRIEYEREKKDEYDDRRRRDKDRGRRSISDEPPRKTKKKSEEEAPAKLLDDLFRKTKATPCIYWLPLTAEQIALKEELRRKHMAEHEKRVAEMRKIQRDQNKRNTDKRRRRSKSRSRSRSQKK